MPACTQCQALKGAPATVGPHDRLVRGTTEVFAAGREVQVLDGLEWYRCITCNSHLVRDRDRAGVPTQWTLVREGGV